MKNKLNLIGSDFAVLQEKENKTKEPTAKLLTRRRSMLGLARLRSGSSLRVAGCTKPQRMVLYLNGCVPSREDERDKIHCLSPSGLWIWQNRR
jgi:hypothetical protein